MPDNNMLYPTTPAALQPASSTLPGTGGAPSPAPRAFAGSAPPPTPAGPSSVNWQYGPAPAHYLAPSVAHMLGIDTTGAAPGMEFNTATQKWEIPPPEWAALGGAHAPDFPASGTPAPSAPLNPSNPTNVQTDPARGPPVFQVGGSPATTADHFTDQLNSLLSGHRGTPSSPTDVSSMLNAKGPQTRPGAPGAPPTGNVQKSGPAGTTPSTGSPAGAPSTGATGAPGGFGTVGDLNNYRGSQKPVGLPPWLEEQFTPTTTVDEGGTQTTTWSLNNNPYGGFLKDGKYWVQVGANQLKNPNAVVQDPELGAITEVGNVHDLTPQGPNYGMLAAVISAGLLGPYLGLGEGTPGALIPGTEPLPLVPDPPPLPPSPPFTPYIPPPLVPGAPTGGSPLIPGTEPLPPVPNPPPLPPSDPLTPYTPGAPLTPGAPPPTGGTPGTPTPFDPSKLLNNPITRALAPSILGPLLRPPTGPTTGGHTGTGTGTGTGTSPGNGGTGSIGTGGPDDALRAQLLADLPLGDDARNTLLNHGKPTDSQTAAINAGIDQERTRGREAILQASINSGQGGADSMVVQDKLRAFDTQLETQRQELMQKQAESNTSTALQELGYISKESLAYAELQFRESQDLQALYLGLFDSLGKFFGTPANGDSNGGSSGAKLPGLPNTNDNQTPTSITDENGTPIDANGFPLDGNGELQYDP